MTNPGSGTAQRVDRLEIPAEPLRRSIIRLFETISGSREERLVFLSDPQRYLARFLPVTKTRQARSGSIEAVLAALARQTEYTCDGTSTALAGLVKLAFSTASSETLATGVGAVPASDEPYWAFTFNQNFNFNQNSNWSFSATSNFSTTRSGSAEEDPRLSSAHLRAALESYVCKETNLT